MKLPTEITGEPYKEKRMTAYGFEKSILIYPTNIGPLSINEMAQATGKSKQHIRNKIKKHIFGADVFEKHRPGRPPGVKNIERRKVRGDLKSIPSSGTWEVQQ